MISQSDFVKGKPLAYKSPKGIVVMWFDPMQGVAIKTKKGVEWTDVFTKERAIQLFCNMNLSEVQVKEPDLSIPKQFRREVPKDWDVHRKKLIEEQRNPQLNISNGSGGQDFRKPKGMSDEEWKAKKATEEAAKKAKREERLKDLKANRLPKVSAREGMVDMAAIAKELGVIPRELRGILRAKKYPKPGVGWAWKEGKELDEVKDLLRKALAEGGAKNGGAKKGGGKKLKIPPA